MIDIVDMTTRYVRQRPATICETIAIVQQTFDVDLAMLSKVQPVL